MTATHSNLSSAGQAELPRGFRQGMSLLQMILLLVAISCGALFVVTRIDNSPIITFVLFCGVVGAGMILCQRTQRHLRSPTLNPLGAYWLIKLILTLLILHISWIPILESENSYDPVRYYYQAQELIDNNFVPDLLAINYIGIIYYYAGIFFVFGHNPLVAALVNSIVTLGASLYLLRVGYEIKVNRDAPDWTLALAILTPEIVWYDALTSRETLLGALVVFATITAGRFLLRTGPVSLRNCVVTVSLALFGIAAVRTSMLLPVLLSIMIMALLLRPRKTGASMIRVLLAVAAIGAIALAVIVQEKTGELIDLLNAATSASENIAMSSEVEFSQNSVSMLLMPDGVLQAIAFVPARMVLYLVAPLPTFVRPIFEVVRGTVESWQVVFTVFSSLFNVVAFPYAIGGMIHAVRTRHEDPAPLVFHVPYWCTFLSIAGGNLIIHERYRVMATLLLVGCAWLGAQTCPKRLLIRTQMLWYGLLTTASIGFILYKA